MSLECIEKFYIKQKWMVRWLLSSLKNSSTMLSVQYTAYNNNNDPPVFFHVYMQVYFSIERIFFSINLGTFFMFFILLFLEWYGVRFFWIYFAFLLFYVHTHNSTLLLLFLWGVYWMLGLTDVWLGIIQGRPRKIWVFYPLATYSFIILSKV